jgi:hypothetical protein
VKEKVGVGIKPWVLPGPGPEVYFRRIRVQENVNRQCPSVGR